MKEFKNEDKNKRENKKKDSKIYLKYKKLKSFFCFDFLKSFSHLK
jgi:hypothetical protein